MEIGSRRVKAGSRIHVRAPKVNVEEQEVEKISEDSKLKVNSYMHFDTWMLT